VLTRQIQRLLCFKDFTRHTEGDTEANAACKLYSTIGQMAEGKRLLFILPVDFFFTYLPVPSVLLELAILSVSLSLDDFLLSPSLRLCIWLLPHSPLLSESAFDLVSPFVMSYSLGSL